MANQFLGKHSFSSGLGMHTGHGNLEKSRKNNEINQVRVSCCSISACQTSLQGWYFDAFSRDQDSLYPGEVLGQRQETLLWISAAGCSFEELRVSAVRHQPSSSLKPSHPIQHQWEGGRLKTAGKSREQGAAGLQQGLEAVLLTRWVMGGREGFGSLVSLHAHFSLDH